MGTLLGWLKVAPWVLAAMGIAWGFWERSDYYQCVAARTEDARAIQKAILEQTEKDRARTAEIEARHLAETIKLRQEATEREDAILRAKPSSSCKRSAPVNAFLDSVRREQRTGRSAPAK